jgi:pimeloyl-ACP methyl ester carboxylesterase
MWKLRPNWPESGFGNIGVSQVLKRKENELSGSTPILDLDQCNMLHYEVHQQADAKEWLVFIHGAGGAIETWNYQIQAFAPHFNLLLLDLRDHGKSKNIAPYYEHYDFDVVTRDVLEVIDNMGVTKAHFMSLSLGSVILQRIAIERPELVDRMVMAGGIFKASLKMHFFVHSAKALNYILPYRSLYSIFSWIVLPRKNHSFSRRVFKRQFQKLSREEYLKWVGLYKHFFRCLREYFYKPVEKLSLVVMGDQDHVFLGAAQKFAKVHKNVNLTILDKCGHICNIENHLGFNERALEFLKG